MGVFHGFIGVIAFIAYALPFMFVTRVHPAGGIADGSRHLEGNGGSLRRGFAVVKIGASLLRNTNNGRSAHFLCCRSSALRSANSLTRKPIFGWEGSRSGLIPYSRRVSDVTGPIDPTTARRSPLATS
jgi:hypothetical protein